MIYLLVGGAGFIGSYCVDYLLSKSDTAEVRVYDNFTSGKLWHLGQHSQDPRLIIFPKDIYEDDIYYAANKVDAAYLFAANPDIARAAIEPNIDFQQGTALTQIVLEALRKGGCPRLFYASGSGVYGETGYVMVSEDFSPMEPISTYGASKLGCEALIASYCHMFGLKASAFRFGNVVGGRQTHGVAYDFIRSLRINPNSLDILGDGSQSKPYVHVTDIMTALETTSLKQEKVYDVFNVAPNSFLTVTEIAHIVMHEMGIPLASCTLNYGVGNRGWKGDVPIVRLSNTKISQLGWNCELSSYEAMRLAVQEMLANGDNLYAKI